MNLPHTSVCQDLQVTHVFFKCALLGRCWVFWGVWQTFWLDGELTALQPVCCQILEKKCMPLAMTTSQDSQSLFWTPLCFRSKYVGSLGLGSFKSLPRHYWHRKTSQNIIWTLYIYIITHTYIHCICIYKHDIISLDTPALALLQLRSRRINRSGRIGTPPKRMPCSRDSSRWSFPLFGGWFCNVTGSTPNMFIIILSVIGCSSFWSCFFPQSLATSDGMKIRSWND